MKTLETISTAIVAIVFAAIVIAILGLPIMWLWNYLMPDLFGLPTITLWQSIMLTTLGKLITGHTYNTKEK